MNQKQREREARLRKALATGSARKSKREAQLRAALKSNPEAARTVVASAWAASALSWITRATAWPSPRIRVEVDYNYPQTFDQGDGI